MSYLALCAAPYDDTESMAPISPGKEKREN